MAFWEHNFGFSVLGKSNIGAKQHQFVISLYLGAAIKQNRQTKSVFSLTKHMRDIRQVIRKAKASHWGRWRATGESTTSGARQGLPDYEPYVKHFAESKRKNGRGCKILLNKAPVQGDYFLEFESVETCPIHFFLLDEQKLKVKKLKLKKPL